MYPNRKFNISTCFAGSQDPGKIHPIFILKYTHLLFYKVMCIYFINVGTSYSMISILKSIFILTKICLINKLHL